jgi:hypothetical protein
MTVDKQAGFFMNESTQLLEGLFSFYSKT